MIIKIDLFLTRFIFNLPHNFLLNSFFGFFSIKGVFVVIWLVIFFYLILIEEKRHKEFIIFFLSSLLISSFFTNVLIKNLTRRPRPFSQIQNSKSKIQSYKIPNYQLPITNYPKDYSFPSGHATFSFAAATILAYFDKKRKKIFYLIALLISFSRIYLGYHYFFDVVGGAILGWLISVALIRFLKPVIRN